MTIKNTIKRMALTALVAGVLLGSGCSKKELPINQSAYDAQKQRQESQRAEEAKRIYGIEQEFEGKLSQNEDNKSRIRALFNDSLADGELSPDEQKNLEGELRNLELTRKSLIYEAPAKYSELVEKCGASGYYHVRYIYDTRLERDSGMAALESQLGKNLHGLDIGTPKLEKRIQKQGIEVHVTPCFSSSEKSLRNAGLLGLAVSIAMVARSYYKSKK